MWDFMQNIFWNFSFHPVVVLLYAFTILFEIPSAHCVHWFANLIGSFYYMKNEMKKIWHLQMTKIFIFQIWTNPGANVLLQCAQKQLFSYALSFCQDKTIFYWDKIKIAPDKIFFVLNKDFCPRLKISYLLTKRMENHWIALYKIFCLEQKSFSGRQFWFCPRQE